MKIRNDSLYKWGDPYFDELQSAYVWGICDAPAVKNRDDDSFYTIQEGDRFDKIAYDYLGEVRYFWIVMEYNGVSDALSIDELIGKQIRIPSKTTIQKIYVTATQ